MEPNYLKELVLEALRRAKENGYDFMNWPFEDIVTDMISCDSEIEKFDPVDVFEVLQDIHFSGEWP